MGNQPTTCHYYYNLKDYLLSQWDHENILNQTPNLSESNRQTWCQRHVCLNQTQHAQKTNLQYCSTCYTHMCDFHMSIHEHIYPIVVPKPKCSISFCTNQQYNQYGRCLYHGNMRMFLMGM